MTGRGGERLPVTAWAVLGMLSYAEELSGYDVKKWADRSIRFFYWSPALSQIYAELRRLEALGYAVSRPERHDDLRNKRVYSITDAGRAALRTWLHEAPVGHPVLKHGLVLRVWMGHLGDVDELRALVTEYRDRLRELLREVEEAAESTVGDDSLAFPGVSLRWSVKYYRNELDLAGEMLDDLNRLASGARRRGPDGG